MNRRKIMTKAYDFDVTITGRHEELEKEFKDNVIEQMLKLTKFHSHILDGNVIIDRNNSFVKVEVKLRVPGSTITAVDKNYNQIKAIDAAIDKAKTQLKKLKSKIVDHRGPSPSPITESDDTEDNDLTE